MVEIDASGRSLCSTLRGEFPDLEGNATETWGPKVGRGEWQDHAGKLLGLCLEERHDIAALLDPLCVVGYLHNESLKVDYVINNTNQYTCFRSSWAKGILRQ